MDERINNIKINEAPSVAPLASSATVGRARNGSHKIEKKLLGGGECTSFCVVNDTKD